MGWGSYLIAEESISISIEVQQGLYHSTNNLFRRMYGNVYPTFIGFGMSVKEGRIKILSGLSLYMKSGKTIITPADSGVLSDRLKLSNYTVPIHLYYNMRYKSIKPFIFGGLAFSMLKEEWIDISLCNEQKKIGYDIGGGVEFYNKNNWSLSTGLMYTSIKFNSLDDSLTGIKLNGYNLFLRFSMVIIKKGGE